ncbi:helix-turn-helix domain-containing protein [Companilactobacillus paralimentarius]|mgnify:CR=1 FL=1|uniref:helix-turn-helix domain-containing protein n=1 Tax=Companilactobacillus paralimentarius TaxID=83526 RepID=UPI0004684EA0|nr:helix-turn-helix domain-containing protein [Companilactobacillus paralimentarius]MDR4933640.1 helix-turn-helix domain-containing protein [Companilactobacillus paralimentarius]QFR70095.1 hypothetical protein LP238_10290 [Companilactobacillus paralimentarius]
MVKFNLDFRIKVVTEYFSGYRSTALAKSYGVAKEDVILNWVHNFELRGVEGLEPCRMDLNYSSNR